jgi:DUF1365 family protein
MTRDAGGPKLPALSFYKGKVMHARMKPVEHRFAYKMSSILIDLDRLQEASRVSPFFSVNRRNLVSFSEADFGARDGKSLRSHVVSLLRKAGVAAPASIYLLCYPKVLGNGFNPLSVYFCRNDAGALSALVYEVRNTFGEHHTYVEPVLRHQVSKAGIRQETAKQFYVSPFMDMDMRYRFRIRPPGEDVAIRILETDSGGPILSATFCGKYLKVGTASLLATLLQSAGLTWKVVAGIHFEALRLWLKGMKLRPRKTHRLSHSIPNGSDDRPAMVPGSGSQRRLVD